MWVSLYGYMKNCAVGSKYRLLLPFENRSNHSLVTLSIHYTLSFFFLPLSPHIFFFFIKVFTYIHSNDLYSEKSFFFFFFFKSLRIDFEDYARRNFSRLRSTRGIITHFCQAILLYFFPLFFFYYTSYYFIHETYFFLFYA